MGIDIDLNKRRVYIAFVTDLSIFFFRKVLSKIT